MTNLMGGYWSVLKTAVGARLKNRRRGEIIERRVDFGPDPRQHILFMYDNDPPRPRNSAIFFIHGGAWSLGSPDGYKFIGQYFGALGFPVVMAGYRLAPRAKFTDQVEDIFKSLEIGLKVIGEHGLPHADIIVSGQSAGAHLAGLLVFDRAAQARYHVDQNVFSGLASISGPLDLAGWENRRLRNFFSNLIATGDWEEANPVRHITGEENIPVICFHGARDAVVPIKGPTSFVDSVNRHSPGLAEMVVVENARHTDVMSMFTSPRPETKVLERWLDRVDIINSKE